jgi:hypothetical protein
MTLIRPPAAWLALSTFAICGTAHADPAVFDSEDDVKIALSAPFAVAEGAGVPATILVGRARRTTIRALRILDAASTPDALAAAPAGVEFACPYGGAMTARLSATRPRLLTLNFAVCGYAVDGMVWDLTGPAEVRFTSATFSPKSVAEIRLGSTDTDLVERFFGFDHPNFPSIELQNLRVAGHIGLVEHPEMLDFFGPFEFRISGFMNIDDGTFRNRYYADNVYMNGERTQRNFGEWMTWDYRTHYEGGTLGHEVVEIETGVASTRTFEFGDLRTRTSLAHRPSNGDTTTTLDIDGDIDITMPAGEDYTGCVNGEYRFRTIRPLFVARANTSPTEVVDGDLRINDSLTALFTALPRPTTHVFARGVGYFRYHDPIRGLPTAAPCAW